MSLDRRALELVERARPIGPSDRILDLGSENDHVARLLRERLGPPTRIEHAGSEAALLFANGSFELVFCLQLPVPDRSTVLREIHRILTPGGRLLAGTPSTDAQLLQAELIQTGFTDVRLDTMTFADVVGARKGRDNHNER